MISLLFLKFRAIVALVITVSFALFSPAWGEVSISDQDLVYVAL